MTNIIRNRIFWVVIAIMIVGGFLRAFHFGDWMHYELDQARDFRIVDAAITYGPGELPLQGPRAAGSFLRLGPLFYYLEYASALIFGNTPVGAAMIVLILSVLTIPLFYVFLRRLFRLHLSLALTALAATSLFLVSYSRFAWNPNLVPFFTLAFLYALLRATDGEEKKKGWWLVLASAALAFATNMHFLAVATLPIVGLAYILIKRPKIALPFWIGAIALFVFLNTPLIVNDVKTGGRNVQEFFLAVTDKSGKSDKVLIEKVYENTRLHAVTFWLIYTGDGLAEFVALKDRPVNPVPDIQCDYDCRKHFWQGVAAFAIFFGGIAAGVLTWRRAQQRQRDVLVITSLLFVLVFVAYVPLAFDLTPRFFLLAAPAAFVILGLFAQTIFSWIRKAPILRRSLVLSLIAACVVANLSFTIHYFHELSRAGTDATLRIGKDRILGEKTRVTYGQMQAVVDYMQSKQQEDGGPIFMHGQAEYKRAFWQMIEFRGIQRDHIPKDLDTIYRFGHYFVVVRTQSNQDRYMDRYWPGFDLAERRIFGTLTVYYLSPKEEAITHEEKEFEEKSRDPKFSTGVQKRYLWRQVLE